MARPLRIEFAGAVYHLTARGDRGESIYQDDEDCDTFLSILAAVIKRYDWVCHAFCLMPNHYHLLVETREGNLSQGMRHLNGVYTQTANRRHRAGGHLFQGRFKGILVDGNAYLLDVARHIVTNPVRAGVVSKIEAWPWSSYPATVGVAPLPQWLTVDGILGRLGGSREVARQRYCSFVADGSAQRVWDQLRQQIYLGDEEFVTRMQAMAGGSIADSSVPRAQRRPPAPPLATFAAASGGRDAAIVAAYASGGYSYREIAEHFGLHLSTVGRVVRGTIQENDA